MIFDNLLALIEKLSVIIVVAYLATRTRFFIDAIERRYYFKNRLFLIIVFGLFSIYGSLTDIKIGEAIVNVRDLGPIVAGLAGGPIVGLFTGLIGGAHRCFFMPGFTRVACGLSTVLAGVIAGFYAKHKGLRRVEIWEGLLLVLFIELVHDGMVLLIAKPFSAALTAAKMVTIPMIGANLVGMAIFIFIVHNLRRERETERERDRYYKELAENERMKRELEIAHELQMSMVSKHFPAFPDRDDFDIYATMKPAKEVGGDLYDFFPIDKNRICFVIGDVAGKGVPAALMMAITKTLIKFVAKNDLPPEQILSIVNEELSRENSSCMFVTAFCGILDTRTGMLVYSNGGHNNPYIIRKNGAIETLDSENRLALGVIEGFIYIDLTTALGEGDSIFLYTDGVTEAINKNNIFFTEQRLEDALKTHFNNSIKDIVCAIVSEVDHFSEGIEQTDDITVLGLKFMKKQV
ncbi:SpoIIE family protein phosphatase [bacterium]|nr:SpoIIE family protein phosphatase [bacterium]